MNHCLCDGSGWYTKTVEQFERDNGVRTGLPASQEMQFPCPIHEPIEDTLAANDDEWWRGAFEPGLPGGKVTENLIAVLRGDE